MKDKHIFNIFQAILYGYLGLKVLLKMFFF